MFKVVASLTTNPGRLMNLEPVIISILHQDYPPFQVEINVPDKYKNKEDYSIPDFLLPKPDGTYKYPNVKVIRTGKDIGPASKVIPTLVRYKKDKDVFIVSFDDDHRYPPKMISTLLRGIVLYGDKKVYAIGGIDLHAGAKMTLEGFNPYYTGPVTIIEGVFGVLYNPRIIDDDVMDYFEKVNKCKECLTSDDVTISNYLAWKNIDIIRLHFRHFNKLILYKQILFHGLTLKESEKDAHAIHLMPGGHKRRYFDACIFLKENNMLYLKIRKGCRNA
jgi:hypothetical protein